MAGTNNFLAFGTGVGANVMSQATYAALGARTAGFTTGIADPLACNKAWRQACFVAAVMGDVIAQSNRNALDDGVIATFRDNFLDALADLVPFRLPPGIILTSADNSAPTTRSILADGAVLLRAGTYAALFAKIGTTFNTGGEGGTEFRIPDLRGVFIRGQDAGRGIDLSRVFGSLQDDMIKTHKHVGGMGDSSSSAPFGHTGTDVYRGTQSPDTDNYLYHTNDGSNFDGTVNAAGAIGVETRPVNVALQFYITY